MTNKKLQATIYLVDGNMFILDGESSKFLEDGYRKGEVCNETMLTCHDITGRLITLFFTKVIYIDWDTV